MSNRFSDTDRWTQKWYRALPPDAKLIYEFVYSVCDIAGFYEWDEDGVAFHTGLKRERVLRGREALVNTFETNGRYVWIPNFIMISCNWPLNEKVGAHKGIIKRLEERSTFSKNVGRLLSGEGLPNGYEGDSLGLWNPIYNNTDKNNGSGKNQEGLFESKPETSYRSTKGKILKGKVLERFEAFLTAFGNRDGKADAADSWFKLKPIPDELYAEIIAGAKRYALTRVELKKNGGGVKMAQGWLTSRRWEDKLETSNPTIHQRDASEYEKAFDKEA